MTDPLYCPWVFGAPCLKPEVWAAWAQALLSVAAIRFAARLAFEQDRRSRKRRLDALMELFVLAEERSQLAARRAQHQLGARLHGDVLGFSRLASGFAAIPLYDLPDCRLVSLVDLARDACEDLNRYFDQLADSGEKHSMESLSRVFMARDTLSHCADEAMAPANDAVAPQKVVRLARRLKHRLKRIFLPGRRS
ncbi:hypothetical protein [Stenotrophomonas maltophilia]|uniref:hypothetical protein n=1 Tax=Stenotrophomonas maltophilia TaxID=40324 RepID=UPI002E75D092|nr:hypothetical protein [Stenotrophomonas maltophilia]